MSYYYAIQYHGGCKPDKPGGLAGHVTGWTSRAKRDAYVAERPTDWLRSEPMHRDALQREQLTEEQLEQAHTIGWRGRNRTYYAITYTYGVASNPDGTLCGGVTGWPTRAERDQFVDDSTVVYRSEPGYREAVLRRHLDQDQIREAVTVGWRGGQGRGQGRY